MESFLKLNINNSRLANAFLLFALLFIGVHVFAAVNTIKVDGSSTVFPLTEAVAEEFQTHTKGKVRVTVGISGTGGGFKKFCRGETDVQNASRPILTSEMKDCAKNKIRYIELPVAFDALSIVTHPSNTWLSQITVAELKTIWEASAQGKIKFYDQVNSKWPHIPIALYGPGPDSGTFDYFTEAVNQKAKSIRGDYTASEDDNTIVQGISRDKGGLGYFGLAYYEANKDKIKLVAVQKDEKSKAVLPSPQSVQNGSYQPLSRPIFIYVSEKSLSSNSAVLEFSQFFLKNSILLATEVKYIALPQTVYSAFEKNLMDKKFGTAFGGHSEVGIKIDELSKRTLTQ